MHFPHSSVTPGGTAEFCPVDIRSVYDRLRPDDACPPAPHVGDPRGFAARYALGELVARGGMGEIWRARDVWFDRPVAVKLLRAELAAEPAARSRFLREARLHARLTHTAVVPVFDLGTTPHGRPYLTMEYIDGVTLHHLLSTPAFRQERMVDLVRVFRRVCQAVAYAHERRVLHRDLKPHNVMITRGGKVRLIDWGLAAEANEPAPDADPNDTLSGGPGAITVSVSLGVRGGELTGEGAAVGTPAYMSPEQARGEFELVGMRADVFGLGAVLCEILTGRPPFAAARTADVFRMARDAELAPARDRLMRCGADVRLIKLCLKCLAHNPLDRPRDVNAVLARLPGG